MFRLLRYFSLTSLVSVAIITTLLAFFYRQVALSDLVETGERHNAALSRALANLLWPEFGSFLTSTTELSDDALRNHTDIGQIRESLSRSVKGLSVLKIKIYDLNGRTVFSSEAKQIGEDKSKNAGFISARSGIAASEITHRDTFSAFEAVIEDRDLISSYIPVRSDGAQGKIEGVFELYYDITDLFEKMKRTQITLIGGVILLLGLLYGALFLIVRHADKLIQRQEAERKLAERALAEKAQDLQRSNSDLEQRKRLQEAMRLHLERITALKDVNVALTANLNLASVLEVLCDKVGRLLPDFGMAVRLWSREQALLESVATVNYDDSWWQSMVTQPERKATLSETVFASKQPLVISDVANEPRLQNHEFWQRSGFSAYLGIPLIANDEILGVIAFFLKQGTALTSQEIEFLGALASQASVAIRNSQIHGEMKKLASDLERSNHVKEEFLGVISHELRTPLNVVRGYIEILQTGMFGEMNSEQMEAVEKIANQTRIQLAMINSILNATTMESEVASVQTEVFSLGDFLADFRVAFPDPADGHLRFEWRYSRSLPEIRSDRTKLQYILQNLINNAVKYTPRGMVAVSAEVRMGAPSVPDPENSNSRKCWLTLRVSDTGVGIAEEFLPVIFEKFSQVDSSTTRAHEGIGLGLHIVKRCTELLNGSVKVESEVGKGTTFSVTIPCEIDVGGIYPGSGVSAAELRLGTAMSCKRDYVGH